MSDHKTTMRAELPPVPYPFIAQPELYHMAVRMYLDTVVERAGDNPSMRSIIGVLQNDARALNEGRKVANP